MRKCKTSLLKSAILGVLAGWAGLISVSAQCPTTATDVGSGQSISTTAKGSGINVQSGVLPGGVAPCQVITVCSTVKYAGITTYAWHGTTATVTPITGLTIFGTQETVQNVAPANFTSVVLSDPADPTCPGVLSENLLCFDYTPSAADVAAGGVTFLLQYAGVAQSGANDAVSGTATITVKIHDCGPVDLCHTVTCEPNLAGLATCVTNAVPCSPQDACHTASCDPATGNCVQTVIPCNPQDACHTASCDPATGVCTQTAIPCNPQDACHTASCDPATGVCTQTAIPCNPQDACHTASCDPATGVCTQTAIPCNPQDGCHTASCDPATGICSQTAIPCNRPLAFALKQRFLAIRLMRAIPLRAIRPPAIACRHPMAPARLVARLGSGRTALRNGAATRPARQ
jgi:hypothetical protein